MTDHARCSAHSKLVLLSVATVVVALAATVIFVAPAAGLLRDAPGRDITLTDEVEIVSLGTSWGQTARLWEAKTTNGGQCTLLELNDPAAPATQKLDRTRAGGSCSLGPAPAQTAPIRTGITRLRLNDGSYGVLLSGNVAAQSGITQLTLATSSRVQSLPLTRGSFLTELPRSTNDELSPETAPGLLVGLDQAGAKLATVNLNDFLAAATPRP